MKSAAPLLLLLGLLLGLGFFFLKTAGDPDAVEPTPTDVAQETPSDLDSNSGTSEDAETLESAGDSGGRTGIETAEPVATFEGPAVTIQGTVALPPGSARDATLKVYALNVPCRYQEFVQCLDGADDPLRPESQVALLQRLRGAMTSNVPVAPDGSFTIEVPAAGRVTHLMVRGRYLYTASTQAVRALPDAAPVLIEPRHGACITGSLKGPGDAATSAVLRIFSMGSDGTMGFGGQPGGFTCAFDVSGEFTLSAIPCVQPYQWSARSENYGGKRGDLNLLTPLTDVPLPVVLDGGERVAGKVTDGNGTPIGGATVTAWLPGKIFGMDDDLARRVVTGEDGRYELIGLPSGRVKVNADHPARLDSPKVDVHLEGEPKTGVDLVLESGQAIEGTVRREDGGLAEGVVVTARFDAARVSGPNFMNAMRGATAETTTDAEGKYRLTGLGAGPFVVEATQEDDELDWLAQRDGVLPSTRVDLILALPTHLAGRVVDDTGVPVPGFSIIAKRKVMGDFVEMTVAYERGSFDHEGGEFLLPRITAGEWQVTVEADGLISPAPFTVVAPSEEAEALELPVVRASSVTGNVLGPDGQPFPGATVRIDPGSVGWQVQQDPYPEAVTAVSDEEGNYAMPTLVPGNLGLRATASGYCHSATSTFEVAPGETREDVTLRLTSGGTLVGDVYDDDARPAAGYMIMAFNMAGMSQVFGGTDNAGHFRMENMPPGAYMVMAMDPSREISVGAEGIDMGAMMSQWDMSQAVLKEGQETYVVIGAPPEHLVTVTGSVTLDGEPYEGALVSFVPPGEKMYANMKNVTVREDGSFELELDGTGAYVVSVQVITGVAGQQSSIEFAVDIPEHAKEHRADFELPLGRISGRLTGPEGSPAGGARVTLTSDGVVRSDSFFGGQYTELVTEPDGTFDVRALRPGTYRLSAGGASPYSGAETTPYGRVTSGNLELDEGEWMQGVDLRLPRPGRLEVTVTTADGKPVPGASIFVRDESGRMLEPFSMVVTNGAGRCDYGGVAPGRVTVTARSGVLTCTETAPIQVPEGGSRSVHLELEAGTILWVALRDKSGAPTTAAVSVTDEDGREMTGAIGMSDLQALYMEGQFSPNEHRLGPLPPGKYTVTAVIDGIVVDKLARLRGEAQKKVTLRAR